MKLAGGMAAMLSKTFDAEQESIVGQPLATEVVTIVEVQRRLWRMDCRAENSTGERRRQCYVFSEHIPGDS